MEDGDSLNSCLAGGGDYPAISNAEHASPQDPLNSKRMTKQQLIEKVAAKTELKKSEVEVEIGRASCRERV